MKVKLDIAKLSIPNMLPVCADIVAKMTGNGNFPNPLPDLADVGKAITQLNTDYKAALDGGKSFKAIMRISDKNLRTLMAQLAAYVQTASGGDEEKIISSGMQVAKKRGPLEPLATPAALTCLHSDRPGEAPLRWKPVDKAKMYFIEVTQTPEDATSWKDGGSSTKSRFTVVDLIPGAPYWFRVSAGGPLGNSAWSDPAKRMMA